MVIELFIGFLLFCVGYLLGRVNLLAKNSHPAIAIKHDKINNIEADTPTMKLSKINIDDRKFVTEIKTDSFQKGFEDFGEKTISEDNISSSVSKLSQLKRNKD